MLKVSKVAYVCWLRCHENHSFLATVYLHLTWVNGGVEAEVSEVADDADYTLMDTYQVQDNLKVHMDTLSKGSLEGHLGGFVINTLTKGAMFATLRVPESSTSKRGGHKQHPTGVCCEHLKGARGEGIHTEHPNGVDDKHHRRGC